MKKTVFALSALSFLLLTSCFNAKNSKQLYKADEDTWYKMFQEGKALDPYMEVTITSMNAGKICFGNDANSDIQIHMSSGNIYAQGYQDIYYIVPADAYDEDTDTYKQVDTYESFQLGNTLTDKLWLQLGPTDFESLSFIEFLVTPCLRIKNLKYEDFTFDNEYNIYKCDSVKSKGWWLPDDPEFTLTDVALHIREGYLQTLEYYINEQNTKITISFFDYDNTPVQSIEDLMQ